MSKSFYSTVEKVKYWFFSLENVLIDLIDFFSFDEFEFKSQIEIASEKMSCSFV